MPTALFGARNLLPLGDEARAGFPRHMQATGKEESREGNIEGLDNRVQFVENFRRRRKSED
jgi:hypothetical protein